MYITIDEYNALYDPVSEKVFNRLAFDACRMMDIYTTGIDGVKKLRSYFPTDEYNSAAVKHCAAKIIHLLSQILDAESTAAQVRGYTETEQGLRRKIISRVEAGNEAISYSETKVSETVIDTAAADKSVRDELIFSTVREYLSGVTDSNGIHLLFMGAYPGRRVCTIRP